MKKISLSKQTLRVLTAQETGAVAGGAPTLPRTQCPTSVVPQCTGTDYCPTYDCSVTCNCPATDTCGTAGCPPVTTNNPRARCACPVD